MNSAVGSEVAEGVGRIPGFVNAYVFQDASGRYLIDTTMSRRARPVVKAFERAGVPLSEVTAIVLTHRHVDHIGGAAFLDAIAPGKVACHVEDAPVVEGKQQVRLSWMMRLFARPRPVPVPTVLRDGDSVGPFRVVFVPGHTPGEIALYHPGRRLLFSGDSVVERHGAFTLPGVRFATDIGQAVRSLSLLRGLEVELLLPGHGQPVRQDVAGRLDELIARAPREFLGAQG